MSGFSLESVAIIDWAGLFLVLLGLFLGLRRGLGSAFALLLWLIAAMWLGSSLAGPALSAMPNTADPNDGHALFLTYGGIVAGILVIPLLIRVLGGPLGRKKGDLVVHNRYMGGLVGVANAVLVFTLATPYSPAIPPVADTWENARLPTAAWTVSENVAFLYHEAFRAELGDLAEYGPDGPTPLEDAIDASSEAFDEVKETLSGAVDDLGDAASEALDDASVATDEAIEEVTEATSDG